MLSFHVKFVQTDRQTTVKQYTSNLSIQGHKNSQKYDTHLETWQENYQNRNN